MLPERLKLNREVVKATSDELGIPEEKIPLIVDKLIEHPKFQKELTGKIIRQPWFLDSFTKELARDESIRQSIIEVMSEFHGRRSFLESVLTGLTGVAAGAALAGGAGVAKADTFIRGEASDFYAPTAMPFSAIVYIDGSKVYAKDWRGKVIAEGTAGTDDVVVIQSAIDVGGRVLIHQGTYNISTTLTIPSNTDIAGEGWKTILKRTFNGNMINQSTGNNILFKSIAFDGGSYSNIMHLWRTGVEDVHYRNVLFFNQGQTTNAWDWAVSFYGANYCSFKGVVKGFARGVTIANGSVGCKIDVIIRDSTYIDEATEGVYIGSDYNHVKAIVYNVGYRGVYVVGNHNIVDVLINKTGDYGLWFHGGEHNIIKATVKEAGMNPPNSGSGVGIRTGKKNIFILNVEKSYYDGVTLGAHISDTPIGTPEYVEENFLIISTMNNNQSGGVRAGLKLYTGTKTDAYIRYNTIKLVVAGDDQTTPTQTYGIVISGSGIMEYNNFEGGRIFGNVSYAVNIGGNNNVFENINIEGTVNISAGTHKFIRCPGYTTENSGTATITGDGTTVTFTVDVAHGLVKDSAVAKITLDRDGTVDKIYLVDADSDGFKETLRIQVTFASAPANGESVPIYWEAQVV